jgi:hypothetical protein
LSVWLRVKRDRVNYIRALLDLIDSLLVERTSIALEAILALVGAFNTLLSTLVQSTLVNISDPAKMALNLGGSDIRLEGDDVLAGDDLSGVNLGSRSSVGEAEKAGRSDGEVLEVNHCGKTEAEASVRLEVLMRMRMMRIFIRRREIMGAYIVVDPPWCTASPSVILASRSIMTATTEYLASILRHAASKTQSKG